MHATYFEYTAFCFGGLYKPVLIHRLLNIYDSSKMFSLVQLPIESVL